MSIYQKNIVYNKNPRQRLKTIATMIVSLLFLNLILLTKSFTDVKRSVILFRPPLIDLIVHLWFTRFSLVLIAKSYCSSMSCSALVRCPLSFSNVSLRLASLSLLSSLPKFNIVRGGRWVVFFSWRSFAGRENRADMIVQGDDRVGYSWSSTSDFQQG